MDFTLWLVIGLVILVACIYVLFLGGADRIYGTFWHDALIPEAPVKLGADAIRLVFWVILIVTVIWLILGAFIPGFRFWIIKGFTLS